MQSNVNYIDIFRLKSGKNVGINYYDMVISEPEELIKKYKLKDYLLIDNIINKKYNDIKEKRVTVVLINNLRCNLNCIYCYEKMFPEEEVNINVKSNAKSVFSFIDKLIENKMLKGMDIILLGGEPLLRINRDFYYDLFTPLFKKYTRDFFSIECVTNGTTIPENLDVINFLDIDSFQITVDGIGTINDIRRPLKGESSFKKIDLGIKLLLQMKKKVVVRMNVDSDNIEEIPKVNEYILEINNPNLSGYIYPVTYGEKDKLYLDEVELFKLVLNELLDIEKIVLDLDFHGISEINNIIKKKIIKPSINRCQLNGKQFIITPSGKISACWWNINDKKFLIGELFEDNYILYDNYEYIKKRNIYNIKECINCKYKFICGAGCAFRGYLNNQNIMSPFCSNFYSLIESYLNFLDIRGELHV